MLGFGDVGDDDEQGCYFFFRIRSSWFGMLSELNLAVLVGRHNIYTEGEWRIEIQFNPFSLI